MERNVDRETHMKIVYLTAGAAGMFCGSCMLDNSLARAFIRRGQECLLVPIYTPIRTDEEDVSLDRVFFGGVNVYLQQKLPFLAYLPRWLDSALNHPALIRRLTSKAGETSPELLGALSVSMLHGMDGRQRKEVLRLCDWLQESIKPDVILLTNLLIGGCIPELKKRFQSKIFVTLQGDDIFLDVLPEPYRQQSIAAMNRLIPLVDKFIVHSHDYGNRMASLLSIPSDKIVCVPAGIDTSDFLRNDSDRLTASIDGITSKLKPLSIGYFARMAPEKGLELLVDAYIALKRKTDSLTDSVQLKMAGWMGTQHAAFWELQQRKLNEAGLQGSWKYYGSLDRSAKLEFFRDIDLLCVPTSYEEPKGLFVLEAVAAGIPYVQPAHGAFPELHSRLHSQRLHSQNINSERLHSEESDSSAGDTYGRLFKPHDCNDLVRVLQESLTAIQQQKLRPIGLEEVHREIGIDRMAGRLLEVLTHE